MNNTWQDFLAWTGMFSLNAIAIFALFKGIEKLNNFINDVRQNRHFKEHIIDQNLIIKNLQEQIKYKDSEIQKLKVEIALMKEGGIYQIHYWDSNLN